MEGPLKQYVQKIKKIPTIPIVAQEILNIVSDDLASVKKIEGIVEKDPAISAKILSVANSVYFGLKTKTNTLGGAIMRIGFGNVRSIALGISLMTVLQDERTRKASDYRRIFNHSVTVGFVSRFLSKKLKLDFSEEIMVNGMLHDLGYLVLNKYFPDTYADVIISLGDEDSLLDVEKRMLGFNHSDIGKWLAEKWNLPNNILDTTLHHHAPSQARRNFRRNAVIHIADYLTTQNMLSPTERNPNYPFDNSCLEILNISEQDLRNVVEEICGNEYAREVLQ